VAHWPAFKNASLASRRQERLHRYSRIRRYPGVPALEAVQAQGLFPVNDPSTAAG
jgi:hypothetical protein